MKFAIRILTGCLFLLLAISPLLVSNFLIIKQFANAYAMEQKLERQNLHTVTIAKQSLRWVKKEKELLVNGQMFDVKKIEYNNEGDIILTGLFDKKETKILKQIEKDQQDKSNSNSQLITRFFHFFQITTHHVAEIIIPSRKIVNSYSLVFDNKLATQFLDIITPPPQL